MSKFTDEQFKIADANNDGKLDHDEYMVFVNAFKEMFESGGVVYDDKQKPFPEIMFKLMDFNKDGFVTLEEWTKYHVMK